MGKSIRYSRAKKLGVFGVSAVTVLSASLLLSDVSSGARKTNEDSFKVLQGTTTEQAEGKFYLSSTLKNIQWGHLPNRDSKPVMSISSGATVTIDTVSHEGILEDQGRDPVEFFGKHGVKKDEVLKDAIAIAGSDLDHDFTGDGPHVVTGPIAVKGAEPGDVLKVEVLSLAPRVPYGVISNRHYKGALPGEFPENNGPQDGASADHPELYANVSTFTPLEKMNGKYYGVLPVESGGEVRFPAKPFMGLMGVAPNTSEKVSSIPPIETGGNIDINELGVGSTLYLPVQVNDALFFTGDPHFAQGDGEVALTAWEASLRGTFRLTVLKSDDPALPRNGEFKQPFAETEDYWIPIGLDEDLDEAMKESVREAIGFLHEKLGMDRATALAYMSAATDYEVSQVVDRTKGIHALIEKRHFINNLDLEVLSDKKKVVSEMMNNEFYVSVDSLTDKLAGKKKTNHKKGVISTTVTLGGKKVTIVENSNLYNVNGKDVYHEGMPVSINGELFIPVKAISEILGASVNWTTSGKTLTANVTYNLKK
ncbi:acetamidase/formamidase family protein [Mesobacillus foraminis]|uniref:acetamidase/formamidase family protein n=1 Tax=Mesobacillus foraminis TaxID=279826 RepID=UPI001BE6C5A7|nr:acetamidase/formamidase family protein [Mesobacillus foraminis]MBT2757507.1 acetamidase/formamidase family protein [Mesobacillus foraminis]